MAYSEMVARVTEIIGAGGFDQVETSMREAADVEEYADNFRMAAVMDPEGMALYYQAQAKGCCGSIEGHILVGRDLVV